MFFTLKWSKYVRVRVHGLGSMRKEEKVVWIILGRSSVDKIIATDKGPGLYLFVSLDTINIAETADSNYEEFTKEMDDFLEKYELFSLEWCRFAWSGGAYGGFKK